MSHVAHVLPSLDRIGGAEQQVMLLAPGLKQRGWKVSVVALSGTGGSAAPSLEAKGVEFVSLRMHRGLPEPGGWMRFHQWLRQAAPDVLHAHLPHAVWLARWSRLAAAVPVQIDTLHTSATGGPIRRLSYRLSSSLPDRITAVSHAAAQAHIAARNVDRCRLLVLPNGVEPQRWHRDAQLRSVARRELGLTTEFLWLAAGRLEPVKDYPTLLRAMARLQVSANLVIAGSGWQQSELTSLSARLGLAGRVRFLGFVNDVERWTQAADAFVLSSRWEGLPTALIEACAAGLPAVATDVPGVREVLGPNADEAMLAHPGDPSGLARAMSSLMLMPAEVRQAIGECAQRFAAEQFSLQSVLDRWENLYQGLLHGCPSPCDAARERCSMPGEL
jgi:glycosyltransferase involved in cell wall biosynthesis